MTNLTSTIIATVIATIISTSLLALFHFFWTRRRRVARKIKASLKPKETEEQKEAERFREMVDSNDPDIWKPLN